MGAGFAVDVPVFKIGIGMRDERIGPLETVLLLVIDPQIKFSRMIILNSIINGNAVGPSEMLLIASATADIVSGEEVHFFCSHVCFVYKEVCFLYSYYTKMRYNKD